MDFTRSADDGTDSSAEPHGNVDGLADELERRELNDDDLDSLFVTHEFQQVGGVCKIRFMRSCFGGIEKNVYLE